MKYLRLSLLLLAASLAYAPAQLLTTPTPAPMIYQLPTQRLFRAVLDKNALEIEDLLKQGGNINEPNKDGDRPIDIAYNQGDFYLVSLLKNYGADAQKERIGKLPQEFKAPPIFEIFFEKSKLKQECIAMLEDTKKTFDQFKQTTQAPEYYSKMDDEEKFYLDFEHATVQEKYPLVYLLLRKQVNVLLAHKSWKPMNKPIQLGVIFSPHEKNLIHHNAHAERETNTIRFGWVFLYNYITNFYTPYTIWNTLAHEWQHLYQLDYSTEIEAANKDVRIEKEIDADFLASKTSLLHTDDVATHEHIKEYFITLIYAYLSSKTAHHPTLLVRLSNHILKAITNLDSHFLNSNLNFIKTSLMKLIDKAHIDTTQNQSPSEYLQYILQFIKNHYYDEIQKPYIQEQQDFTSTHPSDKARNENTLKVRCLYEISLLKKYYGTQASVTISPQNAPYLHALITKDLAIAAIENKSQNQPATDLPQQENSTPLLNPYHDFTYTIQLSDYTDAQQLIPFISEKNNNNTPSNTHDQKFFTITFPESFFIFALCNPQPHKVFSSSIIDARKKTSRLSNESNTSDLPEKQIHPFNKDAFTVFEQLYTIDSLLPQKGSSMLLMTDDGSFIDHVHIPTYNHERAIILFAQIAHILPELGPQLKEAITREKIKKALEHIKETVLIEYYDSIGNISLLSSRQKNEDLVNKIAFTLFAFIANLNSTQNLTTITTTINNKLITAADNLKYYTLIEKIFSFFFGTQQIWLLQKFIEFNLNNIFEHHTKKYQYTNEDIKSIKNNNNENLLHTAAKSNNPNFAKFILEKNIAIDSQDAQGNMPLHHAQNHQIALLLLDHDADAHINAKNNDGETPLHKSIKNRNKQLTKLLLEKGANPNIENNQNETPIQIAINTNNDEIMILLLSQEKINPNIKNKDGESLLHLATKEIKNISYIEALINYGADINAQDINGLTPLHKALFKKTIYDEPYKVPIIHFLLSQKNIQINLPDKHGNTSLHTAIQEKNDTPIIEALLQHGANINVKNNDGNTPLHIAAALQNSTPLTPPNIQLIETLLNHGADTSAENENYQTPAEITKNKKITQLILNYEEPIAPQK